MQGCRKKRWPLPQKLIGPTFLRLNEALEILLSGSSFGWRLVWP